MKIYAKSDEGYTPKPDDLYLSDIEKLQSNQVQATFYTLSYPRKFKANIVFIGHYDEKGKKLQYIDAILDDNYEFDNVSNLVKKAIWCRSNNQYPMFGVNKLLELLLHTINLENSFNEIKQMLL